MLTGVAPNTKNRSELGPLIIEKNPTETHPHTDPLFNSISLNGFDAV